MSGDWWIDVTYWFDGELRERRLSMPSRSREGAEAYVERWLAGRDLETVEIVCEDSGFYDHVDRRNPVSDSRLVTR